MRIAAALLRVKYLRYVGVSATALGIDMTVFVAAIHFGMAAALAAAVGYLVGVGAHWILSTRLVFGDEVADGGNARRVQKALFLTSALVGLGLTVAIVAIASNVGIDPRFAKLVAIVISFQTTYLLRRRIVFA